MVLNGTNSSKNHRRKRGFKTISKLMKPFEFSRRVVVVLIGVAAFLWSLGLLSDSRILTTSFPEQSTSIRSNQREHDVQMEWFIPDEPYLGIKDRLLQTVGSESSIPANCIPTTQFRLTTGPGDQWMLHSLSGDQGLPKRVGGDEMYVVWNSSHVQDDFVLVAMIQDLDNGSYALAFVLPPLLSQTSAYQRHLRRNQQMAINGSLTFYYDYTCGIGSMMPPTKNSFARAGEIQATFTIPNVPQPPFQVFSNPNNDYEIDLSKYNKVIFFGDSLMREFSGAKGSHYHLDHRVYHDNTNQALSSQEEMQSLYAKFQEWHGLELQSETQSVAIVLGSSTWDILRYRIEPDLREHREAIRAFVQRVRNDYPKANLYWKSPSAIHLHNFKGLASLTSDPVWLSRSRYMCYGVPYQVHRAQKALLREMGIPYLDLYTAYFLSAPWSRPGDARHYEDPVGARLLSYYWKGLNETLHIQGPQSLPK
jgi:hypothetical protein